MYVRNRLPGIWHVDLITVSFGGDSTSVRNGLLFTGYAILHDSNEDIEVPMQTINSEKVQLIKNDTKYKENDSFDVIVTYMKDPDHIYVQKVSGFCSRVGVKKKQGNNRIFLQASNQKSIKELATSIEKFYSNKKNKCRVYNPKKGWYTHFFVFKSCDISDKHLTFFVTLCKIIQT